MFGMLNTIAKGSCGAASGFGAAILATINEVPIQLRVIGVVCGLVISGLTMVSVTLDICRKVRDLRRKGER